MFTGIVQAQGKIKEIRSSNNGAVFVLNSNSLDLSDVSIGDSIAVNGVCLTVTQLDDNSFSTDVSQVFSRCWTQSVSLVEPFKSLLPKATTPTSMPWLRKAHNME